MQARRVAGSTGRRARYITVADSPSSCRGPVVPARHPAQRCKAILAPDPDNFLNYISGFEFTYMWYWTQTWEIYWCVEACTSSWSDKVLPAGGRGGRQLAGGRVGPGRATGAWRLLGPVDHRQLVNRWNLLGAKYFYNLLLAAAYQIIMGGINCKLGEEYLQ